MTPRIRDHMQNTLACDTLGIYDSMNKRIKLEEYIKNKMKGIEPQDIFLIINYIYNQVIFS